MNTVKFECPACGQQMECDRARSGDVIHCAGCCAELRIPFSSSKTGLVCVERAELIVPGAAPSAPTAISSSAPAAKAAGEAPSAPAQKTPASATEPVEATCPVCQAHLRFDPKKSSDSHNPPTAELVHHNKLSPGATPAPAPAHVEHCDTQHTQHQHLSFEERERQIAEGRKAHPIQVNTAQKPRLDYILSGGASPPGKGPPQQDHKPVDQPVDQDKSTGHCHPDSFTE